MVLLFSFTVLILSSVCDLSEQLNMHFFPPFSSPLLLIFVSKSQLFHGKWKIKKSKVLGSAEQWRRWLERLLTMALCMPRHELDFLVIPAMAMYTDSTVCSFTFSRISLNPGGAVTELLLEQQDQALGWFLAVAVCVDFQMQLLLLRFGALVLPEVT